MSVLPKICLLYYKNIIDNCFSRFCNDFNDDFKNVDGKYVYGNKASKTKLKSVFRIYIRDELTKYITPNSVVGANYYFIIGSCIPKNNILLDFKDGYFPAKLDNLIKSNYAIKYFLKEKDIGIDLVLFNSIFEELFCEFFKHRDKILKYIGQSFSNLFFIQHARLDCLTLYRTVKALFGKSNTENLHKKFFSDSKVNIYSINECIDKYIHTKHVLNQSAEFKLIATEINQYITECMRIANGKK